MPSCTMECGTLCPALHYEQGDRCTKSLLSMGKGGKSQKKGGKRWVMVNHAPVLTLWAAVVAQVLGFEHDEALTLGRAVAGLNAYSKGVALGLFQPTSKAVKERRQRLRKEEAVTVDLLHRPVPARYTDEGLRAVSGDKPIHPKSVETYLENKFGDALDEVTEV